MPTYIYISTLTDEGAKTIVSNPQRVLDVNQEVQGMGVKVLAQYAVLGPFDFVTVVEAPDNETAARVSAAISARGSVKLQTMAAIPVEQFVSGLRK